MQHTHCARLFHDDVLQDERIRQLEDALAQITRERDEALETVVRVVMYSITYVQDCLCPGGV